jgi:sugar phosphate isomerase/epimerase
VTDAPRRSARELRWPDLVWSHFSRPRFDDVDARVRAAADAGFAGIGLYAQAYGRLREAGRTATDIARFVADHGLVIAEIETVRGWWATEGAAADDCRVVEELAYELADAAGVRYLQAIGPYDCALAQAIDGFGRLCDRAAGHGLLVGIEWLPYTNIATAADAQAIVEGAGRANGGYCADIWHHVRGADDLAMLRRLPADRIFAVQMNDGPAVPVLEDYKADCLATRVPPGDGAFDCVGFVQALIDMGVRAPISLEVASHELWAAPVDDAARAAAAGMRRVLAQVEEAAR